MADTRSFSLQQREMTGKFKLPQALPLKKLVGPHYGLTCRDPILYERVWEISSKTGLSAATIMRAALTYALDNLDESSFRHEHLP